MFILTHLPLLSLLLTLPFCQSQLSRTIFDSSPPNPPRRLNNTSGGRLAPSCSNSCLFTLCRFDKASGGQLVEITDTVPFVLFGAPFESSNALVCKRDGRPIEGIPLIGEASISSNGHLIPISMWRPPGLHRRFRPDVIRAMPFRPTPFFGLARAYMTTNQWSFLHDQCMVVPIFKYTERVSGTLRSVETGGKEGECVAFRTTAPRLHFRLKWKSSGDGDLLVQTPQGNVLDFLNLSVDGGKHNGDNGVGTCGSEKTVYYEDVVYFRGSRIPRGRFIVEAWEASACGEEKTSWSLRVIENGRVMQRRKGTTPGGQIYKRVAKLKYRFWGW